MDVVRKIVRIPEAREMLGGISIPTIYALAKRGDLRMIHIGRSAFIKLDSIERLLRVGNAPGRTGRSGPSGSAGSGRRKRVPMQAAE